MNIDRNKIGAVYESNVNNNETQRNIEHRLEKTGGVYEFNVNHHGHQRLDGEQKKTGVYTKSEWYGSCEKVVNIASDV